jgi:hypothetical protein
MIYLAIEAKLLLFEYKNIGVSVKIKGSLSQVMLR